MNRLKADLLAETKEEAKQIREIVTPLIRTLTEADWQAFLKALQEPAADPNEKLIGAVRRAASRYVDSKDR